MTLSKWTESNRNLVRSLLNAIRTANNDDMLLRRTRIYPSLLGVLIDLIRHIEGSSVAARIEDPGFQLEFIQYTEQELGEILDSVRAMPMDDHKVNLQNALLGEYACVGDFLSDMLAQVQATYPNLSPEELSEIGKASIEHWYGSHLSLTD